MYIPISECPKRLAIKSDIRLQTRLSILNTQILATYTEHILYVATVFKLETSIQPYSYC